MLAVVPSNLLPVGIITVPTFPNDAILFVLTTPGIMRKSPLKSSRTPYIDEGSN